MDIIDEIADKIKILTMEGIEYDTVIIPESRREEIKNAAAQVTWSTPFDPHTKHTIFGCEVIYSADADKIKVGYLK